MRVAVLGGSGQVGAPLCRELMEQGHTVVNIDFATDCDLRIRDGYVVQELYKADFIFFLAFDVGGSTYLKQYQTTFNFIHNNIQIMENVFNMIASFDKPFVFSSTQMSNMSHSSYGVLKRVGEFYTQAIGGVNVRFWNVFGEEFDPDKFHVITDFINMAKNDKFIQMRTDGKEMRQFLHSDDCSTALIALMDNYTDLDKSKFYDITSFYWTSVENVAHIIASEFTGTLVNPGHEKDTVQGVRNEPNGEILKYWEPQLLLLGGIRKVIKDME